MGRIAGTRGTGDEVETEKARRKTLYSRLLSPSQRKFLFRLFIIVMCCYGAPASIGAGVSKPFGWYYVGALALGIILLSFPAIVLIRALGQVAAKRRWRLRPDAIHRMMNFPYAPARAIESKPMEQLPNTVVRTPTGKMLLKGGISLAAAVASIGTLWYFFDEPFVGDDATWIVIAIILLCAGVVGVLGVAKRFRDHRRVILILTPTRLLFPDGSWIAWENVEDIGLFSGRPKREASSKRKGSPKHEEKHESAADWAIENKPGIWPPLPGMCGIRLVSYDPYLRTMNERQKKFIRLGRRMSLGVYGAVIISRLPALIFSGGWMDVLQQDLGVAKDVSDGLSEVREVEELASLTWQLEYSRKRYGFDLSWSRWLDRAPSDLARLMIEYKERLVVDQFLQWEDDPERRRVCLKAAFPRILNQDTFKVFVSSDRASELFAQICRLPFVTEQAGSLTYHEIARTAMLRLQYAQSPWQWRANHTQLAWANAQWAVAVDRGHETWSNPYWVNHIREEMYHLLCAEPVNNLTRALDSAVRAALASTVCARQWANMLSDAGRDADRPELRQWGQRLAAGIQGSDLSQYLTYLINDAQLDMIAVTVALLKRSECHYDADRHDKALADFTRATRELALYPTTPALPGKRSGSVPRQIWWASVPIWSFSLLSSVPFLVLAVRLRRKRNWMVFAAYLAATVAIFLTANSVNAAVLRFMVVALAGCSAVHAGILFRPGQGQ